MGRNKTTKAGSKGITKFGKQLAAFRKKHDLRRDAFANRVGVSTCYVYCLESGAPGSDGEVMKASTKVQEQFQKLGQAKAARKPKTKAA